jgi:hypothetical protein
MQTRTRRALALPLAAALLLGAGAAPAAASLGSEGDHATEADFRPARQDWAARNPWRYGTWCLFPLTRGMDDAGVPHWARPALYVVTVPLDLVMLPAGAIGGLFGD